MIKQHVHIMKMGGTIEFQDPSYQAINQSLMRLDATIDSYFKNLIKPHFSFSLEPIAMKDSREITTEDLDRLSAEIHASPHTNILITHGTYTMKATALYLEEQSHTNKKIVITGSMIPLIGFTASDAGFNLGYAIASYAGIEPGVYISMNGGVFTTEDVEKNEDLFRFE